MNANRPLPNIRSTMESERSASMFIATCNKPKCTNAHVIKRHHSPSEMRGPKFAPQATISSVVDSSAEKPETAIAMNTATFAPMSTGPTQARGGFGGRAATIGAIGVECPAPDALELVPAVALE